MILAQLQKEGITPIAATRPKIEAPMIKLKIAANSLTFTLSASHATIMDLRNNDSIHWTNQKQKMA